MSMLTRLLVLAAAAAVVALALAQLAPPPPLPDSAPASAFSAGRALAHVREVARAPHPVGSAAHAQVRDYLVGELRRLGVVAEIQRATVASRDPSPILEVTDVENVVAVLPGASRRALLVVGHYDSVPTGPGASDDGHAVAMMLEAVRALRTGPPLAHDVIFLFSDGEELGLLGARAFADENPHRGDVALALNFEARGTGGPAFLFQTSPGGSALARTLGEVAAQPMASSLLDDVYRRLPNDTDLTALMRAGIPGMNFAYFDNYPGYHAARDDAAALDPGSLQHQGDNALALIHAFAGGELAPAPAPAATWFSLTRRWLIWYPRWVDAVALAALVSGFVFVVARGRRWGQLRLRGLAPGALATIGALVACPLAAHALWSRLLAPVLAAGTPTGEPVHAGLVRAGFIALTVAAVLAACALGGRRARPGELALGALAVVIASAGGLFVCVPGGAYLAVWPALAGLVASGALVGAPDGRRLTAPRTLVIAAGALVALWLLAPWVHLMFVLLAMPQVAVVVALVVVVTALALPALLVVSQDLGWRAPLIAGVIGLAALAAGAASSAHPTDDSIAYALDGDGTPRAHWITDQRPDDAWTSRLIADATHRRALAGFFPFTEWTFYQADAPAAPLPLPSLRVLANQVHDGVRELRLCVQTGGPAERVLLYTDAAVRGARVAGEPRPHQPPDASVRWAMRYTGAPRFEVTLTTDPNAPIDLRVVDQYFGLAVSAPARPAPLFETPFGFGPSDQTYVGRTFTNLGAAALDPSTVDPAPCGDAPAPRTATHPVPHTAWQSFNAP